MKRPNRGTIGEILIENGMISRGQLCLALKMQESARMSGEALVNLGIISQGDLEITLEILLAELLVGLGYADEKAVFGSLRTGVVTDTQKYRAMNICDNEDLEDFSDF